MKKNKKKRKNKLKLLQVTKYKKYGLFSKFTLAAVGTKSFDHFFAYKKQNFNLENNENEHLVDGSNVLDSGIFGINGLIFMIFKT